MPEFDRTAIAKRLREALQTPFHSIPQSQFLVDILSCLDEIDRLKVIALNNPTRPTKHREEIDTK
jgi:hypothetical protein